MCVADELSPNQALVDAIRRYGTQTTMAAALGIGQSAISKWLSKHQLLPPEHVLAVEAATGISRHDLRPDIYPREPAPAAAPARDKLVPAR